MRFSIITITKNNPIGFEKTRASLHCQTYDDYEWVVIDGDVEPDNGIYDAMNKGIDRANGDYLIFMNAGDQFANENVLAMLAQYDAGFIYGDAMEGGFVKRSKHHAQIGGGMITHHQSMIYRRSVVNDLRYDEQYPIAADYKFTIEYTARCKSFLKMDMAICDYEMGGVSQINAKQGRIEQIKIRRELGMKKPLTFYRQWLTQMIRHYCPNICLKIRMIAKQSTDAV